MKSPLRLVLAATASAGFLAALVRFRPGLPERPDSLAAPLTTAVLQQAALFATWLLAGVVVLTLAITWLRALDTRRSPSARKTPNLALARRRAKVTWADRPVFGEPRLLVVHPPENRESSRPSQSRVTSPALTADPRPVVSLLGPLKVQGGKRGLKGLRAHALELIAFLALRHEGAQRDEILEAIWPDVDPKQSRHRLYQAVRDARRVLGEAVVSERDRYRLDRERVQVDVDELDALLWKANPGDGTSQRSEGAPPSRAALEQALALFRGEPLAGSDYQWAASATRRLRGVQAVTLESVGWERLQAGEARGALEVAERGLVIDVLNEAFWRLALEAEGQLGLREAIEARYSGLQGLLAERLGLEPSRQTRTTYLKLLGQM